MPSEPSTNRWRSVNGRVVDDDVDRHLRRDFLVDHAEKAAKLGSALFRIALTDHFARRDVEGREQVSGAVTVVRRRGALGLAKDQRQDWLAALQRLDLGLLVEAQNDRVVRRMKVEADDVADLFYEELVVAQGEGAPSMRLEVESTH